VTTITIPPALETAFGVSKPVRVCDEEGNIIGYYTPLREASEEDYQWLMNNVTEEQIEASLRSGPCRPVSELIAELRAKYGP
jgi:hypothetical protein